MPCWLFTNVLGELSASIVSVKGCLTPSMEVLGTLEHWQPPIATGAKSPRQWAFVSDFIRCHIVISQEIWIFISITVMKLSYLAIMNILQKFLFAWCVVILSHLLAIQIVFFSNVMSICERCSHTADCHFWKHFRIFLKMLFVVQCAHKTFKKNSSLL